ncbi:MAG: Dps family protein [Bdellovibrionales bacterium]
MPPKSSKNSNTEMAERLIDVLSDTYLLTIKTHGYHWNVTGPQFHSLHLLFEEQYNELFRAADELAERIRALDVPAPMSSESFRDNAGFKEATGSVPSASAMLKDLIKSHESTRARIEDARAFAEEIGDRATEDMLIARLEVHDKDIWMLRSQAA